MANRKNELGEKRIRKGFELLGLTDEKREELARLREATPVTTPTRRSLTFDNSTCSEPSDAELA